MISKILYLLFSAILVLMFTACEVKVVTDDDGFIADQYINLTLDSQVEGSIDTEGEAVWYSFDATAGESYLIDWEDSFRQGAISNFTSDVVVSVYREDGTTLYNYSITNGGSVYDILDEEDSGYNLLGYQTYITAVASEKILIKVQGYYLDEIGTFGLTIMDSSVSLKGVGSVDSEYGQQWYTFNAIAGTIYLINWEDGYDQAVDSDYTLDIEVSVFGAGAITPYRYSYTLDAAIIDITSDDFILEDNGFDNNRYIKAVATEEVSILVQNYLGGTNTGTFSITAIEQ